PGQGAEGHCLSAAVYDQGLGHVRRRIMVAASRLRDGDDCAPGTGQRDGVAVYLRHLCIRAGKGQTEPAAGRGPELEGKIAVGSVSYGGEDDLLARLHDAEGAIGQHETVVGRGEAPR